MKYDNFAQPWQQTSNQQTTLPIKSNNRFFYKHHPKNWELIYFEVDVEEKGKKKTIQKPIWLPDLIAHHETPGVNGTRGFKNNPDSSLTRTRLLDEGITVLHPSKHDYLRSYPAKNGLYWVSRFTTLENLGGELVQTFDKDQFNCWKLELMKNNAINIPHKTFLQRKEMEIQRRIDRHIRSQHIPEIADKLKSLQGLLQDMKQATKDVLKNGVNHYEL